VLDCWNAVRAPGLKCSPNSQSPQPVVERTGSPWHVRHDLRFQPPSWERVRASLRVVLPSGPTPSRSDSQHEKYPRSIRPASWSARRRPCPAEQNERCNPRGGTISTSSCQTPTVSRDVVLPCRIQNESDIARGACQSHPGKPRVDMERMKNSSVVACPHTNAVAQNRAASVRARGDRRR